MKSYKKTRKRVYKKKLVVNVDFSALDGGYEDLKQKKLIKFMEYNVKTGNNLIQTQDARPFYLKKTKMHLQAVPVKEWNSKLAWSEIHCYEMSDMIKALPCEIGSNAKVFVKLKSTPFIGGFATYINAIQMGVIDKKKHLELIEVMKNIFGNGPIKIHNEDVDWFHIKAFV